MTLILFSFLFPLDPTALLAAAREPAFARPAPYFTFAVSSTPVQRSRRNEFTIVNDVVCHAVAREYWEQWLIWREDYSGQRAAMKREILRWRDHCLFGVPPDLADRVEKEIAFQERLHDQVSWTLPEKKFSAPTDPFAASIRFFRSEPTSPIERVVRKEYSVVETNLVWLGTIPTRPKETIHFRGFVDCIVIDPQESLDPEVARRIAVFDATFDVKRILATTWLNRSFVTGPMPPPVPSVGSNSRWELEFLPIVANSVPRQSVNMFNMMGR